MALEVTTHPEPGSIELPSDLAEAFRQVGNRDDPPETLREGFTIIEETLEDAGVEVSLDDMYQSEPTRHTVYIGESTEHVPCVMDALIVAFTLNTDPIEIHSEPPDGGEPVRMHVTGEKISVTPERAVVSFGIGYAEADEADVTDVEAMLNDASTIPTTCSVINAFPDSEAYAQWAAGVSEAAVMELSVEEMVALARRTVRDDAAD